MSEETTRSVEAAAAQVSRADAVVDQALETFLSVVARDLPGKLERFAKRTAHDQPEVTKALGADGVKNLRSELSDEGAKLASEVTKAADEIPWPESQMSVEAKHVRSVLFDFLYGRRVNSLAAIFKRNGFDVHDTGGRDSQGLILPQVLFSEKELAKEFDAVAAALNARGAAHRALLKAQAADDANVVDSLWED